MCTAQHSTARHSHRDTPRTSHFKWRSQKHRQVRSGKVKVRFKDNRRPGRLFGVITDSLSSSSRSWVCPLKQSSGASCHLHRWDARLGLHHPSSAPVPRFQSSLPPPLRTLGSRAPLQEDQTACHDPLPPPLPSLPLPPPRQSVFSSPVRLVIH